MNINFISFGSHLFFVLASCVFLSCKESNRNSFKSSLSLLDVPGISHQSDVYKNLEIGIELTPIERSHFDHEYLSKHFGQKALFFKSKRIPVMVVVVDQSVQVIRIGDFAGFSPRSHPIDARVKDLISDALVSSGVYFPYELAIVENREDAMKMLQLPYSSPARVSEHNQLTVIDFTVEEKDYPYRVILYFNKSDILVGLDVFPRIK